MPTRQTINAMALKFSSHYHFIGSIVYQMEGFSNQIKIEGMVSFYYSSCNLEQFKKVWDRDTHIHTHIHVHTYKHMHTNYLDKSQACTDQASLRGLKMPAYTRSMIKTIKS